MPASTRPPCLRARLSHVWLCAAFVALALFGPHAALAVNLGGSFDTINGQTGNPNPSVVWGDDVSFGGWAYDWDSASREGVTVKVYVNGGFHASANFGGDHHWTGSVDTGAFGLGEMSVEIRIFKTNEAEEELSLSLGTKDLTVTARPPVITVQPVNRAVAALSPTWFSVAIAENPAETTFQWYWNDWSPEGAFPDDARWHDTDSSHVSLTAVHSGDEGQYRVKVTNSAGSVWSDIVSLKALPLIQSTPTDTTVWSGQATSFSVAATGGGALSGALQYQWYQGATPLMGKTAATLSLSPVAVGDAGDYKVRVYTASGGETFSDSATLTVHTVPVISPQPADQTVAANQNATFSLGASGSPSPTYEWQRYDSSSGGFHPLPANSVYSGVSSAVLTISGTTQAMSGDQFRCLVSNSGTASVGQVVSRTATLTVNPPQSAPTIGMQPGNVAVVLGHNALFFVTAVGTPAPTYQWRRNGVDLAGATLSSLAFLPAGMADEGNYSVLVSNAVGSVESATVTLDVVTGGVVGGVFIINDVTYAAGNVVSETHAQPIQAGYLNPVSKAGPVRADAASVVSYVSSVSVRLQAGFRAATGSRFRAAVSGSTSNPPQINSSLHLASVQGQPASYQISATHMPSAPVAGSYGATSLPSWLAIDTATGVISGVPPHAGVFSFGIRATNSAGTDQETVSWTVTLPADPSLADHDGDGLIAAAEANLGRNSGAADNPRHASDLVLPAAWEALAAVDAGRSSAVGVTSGQLSVDKNGAATYSIPLWVSPGTAGMEPKLSLAYSSQGGAGIAGWGWSITGLTAISRGPRTRPIDGVNRPVSLTAADPFYLDGQRLILVDGTHGDSGAEYRTELETFTRVVCYGRAGSGPARFRAWTKAGLIVEYGSTAESAFRPDNGSEVHAWSVSRIYDTQGNYMAFSYVANAGGGDWDQRITRIDYTGHVSGGPPYASVVFSYEDREDIRISYIAGRRVANSKRLKSIRSEVGGAVAREYVLHYNAEGTHATGRSLLREFEEKGAVAAGGQQPSLPRLQFEYETPTSGWVDLPNLKPPVPLALDGASPRGTGFIDLDGDGRPDFVRFHRWNADGGTHADAQPKAWVNRPGGWVEADGQHYETLIDGTQLLVPDWRLKNDLSDNYHCVLAWDGFADFGTRFIDLNADGLVDVLHALKRGNTVHSTAYLNTGQGWSRATNWDLIGGGYLASEGDFKGSSRLLDLNADGRVDVVWNYDANNRGALLNTGNGWQIASSWTPGIKIDGSVMFLDVNGDGLPDQIQHWYGGGNTVRAVALNTGSGWQTHAAGSTDFNRYVPPYPLSVQSPSNPYAPVGAEAVDVNGDGLVDLVWNNAAAGYVGAYFNTGAGWVAAPSEFVPKFKLMDNNTAVGSALLDVNGDGWVDQVVAKESNPGFADGVFLGTGRGWTDMQAGNHFNLPRYVSRYDTARSSGMDFVDLDGDGTADQVWNLNGTALGASRNTASAADRLGRVTTGLGVGSSIHYRPLTHRPATVNDAAIYHKLADLGGIDAAEQSQVTNVIGPMFVVSAVSHDDGVGGQQTLTYRYTGLRTHRERGSLGFQSMVMTDVRTSIVTTTSFEQNYPFIGMPVDSYTRVVGDDFNLSESTTTLGSKAIQGPNGATTRFVFAVATTQISRELNAVEGEHPVTAQSTTTYFLPGQAVDSGYDAHGNSLYVSVDSGGGYSKTTTSSYFDTESGYAGIDPPSENGLPKWHLGRLKRSAVVSKGPAFTGYSEEQIPTSITRTSSFAYHPATGLLSTETVEPDVAFDSPLRLSTSYVYDQWGNKISVTVGGLGLGGTNGALGTRTTEASYEASGGRFLAWKKNALGHAEVYSHDAVLGTVTGVTGPNGLRTQWAYDAFGRKVQEDRPDFDGVTRSSAPTAEALSRTTIAYGWAASGQRPPGAEYFVETRTSGGAPALEFFDRMGRSVGSYTLGGPKRTNPDAGYRIVGRQTRYDEYGRAYRASLPFFLGEAPLLASGVRSFDRLGRPMSSVASADGVAGSLISLDAADGSLAGGRYVETTFDYAGLTATATMRRIRGGNSSLGIAAADETIRTQTTKNLQGWVVSTVRNSDAAAGADDRAETAFLHDPLGQLCITSVRAASGWIDTTDLRYDRRGRKSQMTDKSMGTWTYAYNSAGELVSQTDARSRNTALVYDLLGRMKTRTEVAMTSTGTQAGTITTTWTYDTAVHSLGLGQGSLPGFPAVAGLTYSTPATWVGKLASIEVSADRGRTYAESYGYDAIGRTTAVARTIAGVTHTTTHRFDDYGRATVTVYPGAGAAAGYAIRTVYDRFGFPLEVRDARDVEGLALTSGFRNDISPGFIYWQAEDWDIWGLKASILGNGLQHQRVYSSATGRVEQLHTGLGWPPGPDVLALTYAHDSFGNVSSRVDFTTGRQETFDYDRLDRITTHATIGGGTVTTAFDPLGNIRSKSDNGGGYTYGDSAHPYRVTQANSRTYSYDEVGNIINDGQRQFYYASSGQMQRIVSGGAESEFWFGASHERVMQQQSGDRTTIYVGSLLEKVIRTSDGAVLELRYYVMTPQGRTAVRTETPTMLKVETRWLHQDALGSIVAATNEWGEVERRYTYDAWGKQTSVYTMPDPAQTTGPTLASTGPARGYTDHEMLGDFGLIHMNGRVCDPVLGRFLGADPFIDEPSDSQSYNRYCYVGNNPVNGTDPSGFFKVKDALKIVAATAVGIVTAGAGLMAYGAILGGSFSGGLVGAVSSLSLAGGWTGGWAIAASVGFGFGSALAGSLLNGGSIGDAFKSGIKGGITGGVMAYATKAILEGVRAGLEDIAQSKVRVIEVLRDPVTKDIISATDVDRSVLQGAAAEVWINGMLNSREHAINLSLPQMKRHAHYYILYNESHGFWADIIESSAMKLTGTSSISRDVADIMKTMDLSRSAFTAHSQGGLIMNNAISTLKGMGVPMKGMTVAYNGAAVNRIASERLLTSVGANLRYFEAHAGDLVPNLIGGNALFPPNPFRLALSVLAAPLLFAGPSHSPHTIYVAPK